MRFLFGDDTFSLEAFRTAGFANYRSVELSEDIVTAPIIPDGDQGAWHREWTTTAERVMGPAHRNRERGNRVSAREMFLRAFNYYRTSEFFLRYCPATDPEVADLSGKCAEAFAAAGRLRGPRRRAHSLRRHLRLRHNPTKKNRRS